MTTNPKHEFPSAQHKLVGYPYRVWLFSILSAPLLYTGWLIHKSDDGIAGFGFIIFFPLFFLFFSLLVPAFIIYLLVFWKFAGSSLSDIQKKVLLLLVGATALFMETMLYDIMGLFSFKSSFIFFTIPFGIFSIIFSFKSE
jgi:hypothetical protein